MKAGSKKRALYKRDIFKIGEYIQHFNPDSKWNPFYKIYNKKKQDTIAIINKSKDSRTILDVGGGMGRLSLSLAASDQNRIFLCDISIDMLKLVMESTSVLNSVKLVNANAHYLPFPDDSFDIIVGLDLLCHLEEPERALREFHRVLISQGTLILDSTNSNPLWAVFYPRYMGKNPLKWFKTMQFHGVLPGWETIVKHYTEGKFLSFLQEAGFKVIRQINYGPMICPKWHLAVSKKIN